MPVTTSIPARAGLGTVAAHPDRMRGFGSGTADEREELAAGLRGEIAGGRRRRYSIVALALASVLPCAALLWPDAVPREIVVLALLAWAGIFVVALASARKV